MYNKLFVIIAITFLISILSLFTVPAFAQSEKEEEKITNQTMQNISKSTNKPIQNATQTTANETGEAIPIQKNLLT
ncbi:MAG TPA: hypothetical protein VJ583_11515 [Nitrososphaeraceae archaeon]|nr:hypothetical protein [Nitrososphaeraceae archaeon]